MWNFGEGQVGNNRLFSVVNTILIWNTAAFLQQLYRLLLHLKSWWCREIRITINEQSREWYTTNKVFSAVETYLGTVASSRALRLKASTDRTGRHVVLTMDDAESITDVFFPSTGKKGGVEVKWAYHCRQLDKGAAAAVRNGVSEKKYYTLRLDAQHRQEVVKEYIDHVMEMSREIETRNRQRKLYTNSMGGDKLWTQVAFKHPACFQTLAMNPKKKKEIMDDLETFSKSQDYYAKIGKAWKRGYLLYGPPGTGKSTMIAAMANFLDYDVYDLELTVVKDNTELRRLIINTTSRSIIVIEDIDCSLHLSGARDEKEESKNKDNDEKDKKKKRKGKGVSKVTLSGLLNFIDGLWPACSGERIVVFTTNHVEKLDRALIRRGRMDMHIEMGYCTFEAFKVLAENYLEVEEHAMFERVEKLLEEVEMTPADVAELLMPKDIRAEDKAGRCLEELVRELEKAKEERRKGEVEVCSAAKESDEFTIPNLE